VILMRSVSVPWLSLIGRGLWPTEVRRLASARSPAFGNYRGMDSSPPHLYDYQMVPFVTKPII
jgi:hypothetical protein